MKPPRDPSRAPDRNVLGQPLGLCSNDPMTGFFRDGCCSTGTDDHGLHVVCVRVTAKFLEFSQATGNDLSTPRPEYRFPGLKPGDQWCVCALRWRDALMAGAAAPIRLESTHEAVLKIIPIDTLLAHAVGLDVV